MFPLLIMERYLKLKLEMVYLDLPIEQVRQSFDTLKQPPVAENKGVVPAPAPVVRKRKRIPAKK
jgi:hypothetical protein